MRSDQADLREGRVCTAKHAEVIDVRVHAVQRRVIGVKVVAIEEQTEAVRIRIALRRQHHVVRLPAAAFTQFRVRVGQMAEFCLETELPGLRLERGHRRIPVRQ